MDKEKFHIMITPTRELADRYIKRFGWPEYTVEAEYGETCIDGSILTLAHHGPRSGNPAPCNWNAGKQSPGTILISHIDLDTIGGIMDIEGIKPEDPTFWQGAEFIDVNGLHHIHELSYDVQDKLNAFYAWSSRQEYEKYTDIEDVTDKVNRISRTIIKILDPDNNSQLIKAGRTWKEETGLKIEELLIREDEYIRTFVTKDVFCSASYYSPIRKSIIPCTVVYNKKTSSITVAFADGGHEQGGLLSAREIVQKLWGQEAGGRDGIAGSPRGREMTIKDLKRCEDLVREYLTGESDG